jgi:hypothetical protein
LGNPLASYRAAQRRLRAHFSAFTKQYCPSCPEPCCRKPAKVRPLDLMLAEAHGFTVPEGADPVGDVLEAANRYFGGGWTEDDGAGQPCDFLGEGGCSFPEDLRPYECVRYICKFMRSEMPASWVRTAERLGKQLDTAHTKLVDFLLSRRHKPQ